LSAASPLKVAVVVQAPLLRFLPLQRLRIEASTYRGLTSAATFRPRRFPRPRRFTPLRPLPRSPSSTTPGVSPFRALPDSPRTAPSPTPSPLMTFLAVAPAFYGGELPRLASAPGLQGLTPVTRPYPPVSGFPYTGDRHPLGFLLLWDLASLSAPGPKPVHSQGRTAPSPVPN
jgi:hypothetical protein